ncbi:MAG: hypothetical protein H0V79_04640 [Actinobacteria bacterium]|nr:hypothetical protein [Actinomycetota bacterium]
MVRVVVILAVAFVALQLVGIVLLHAGGKSPTGSGSGDPISLTRQP